jgi:uncharacterized protein with HEPN domain
MTFFMMRRCGILQTMAEASQKLPESLKAQYPEIEWRKISAFRNVIVHNYLGDIDRRQSPA